MRERRQQKLGWVGGWLGGFAWVLFLSLGLLVGGQAWPAVVGLLIWAIACAAIGFLAPWRHPGTTYRRLLAPLYVLFLGAVGWGVWSFGGARQIGLSWWSLLLLMPIVMPLWMGGHRRWQDSDAQPLHAPDGTSRGR